MHFTELKGRKGRIYIARQGTITVIVLDDGTRLWANNSDGSQVFCERLVDAYWVHSIDGAGSFSHYMVNRLAYDTDDKPFYPDAKPLVAMTPGQVEKLGHWLPVPAE